MTEQKLETLGAEYWLEKARAAPAPAYKRPRAEDPFIYIPLKWWMAANRVLEGQQQLFMASMLYRRWYMKNWVRLQTKQPTEPIVASAAGLSCEDWMPSEGVRLRTLKALAAAGLIRVIEPGPGKALRVEIPQPRSTTPSACTKQAAVRPRRNRRRRRAGSR
jgi:hypothetical protein